MVTTILKEVEISLPKEVKRSPTDEDVPTLPANSTITQPATAEVQAIVNARRERLLMTEEYREMADEMLAIAREARAAQIRALPDE